MATKSFHRYFYPNNPELYGELKEFIAKVNNYLLRQADDALYHKSATHGQSKSRSITFVDGKVWKLRGSQHRKDEPYTDHATVYYYGEEIWRMTRTVSLMSTAHPYMDEIKACLREAAKAYDHERPWCGPESFVHPANGFHYSAVYSGTDDKFKIEETVCDEYGALLWKATCEGGYIAST